MRVWGIEHGRHGSFGFQRESRGDNRAVMDAVAELQRGREAHTEEAWFDAYESL
jgi:hypothetical protein